METTSDSGTHATYAHGRGDEIGASNRRQNVQRWMRRTLCLAGATGFVTVVTATTWTDSSTIPARPAQNSGATPFADYGDRDGFGVTGDLARALGSDSAGNLATAAFVYAVLLPNPAGSVIGQPQFIYLGGQWPDSGGAGVEALTFNYRMSGSLVAATGLEPVTAPGGAWAAVAQLDFAGPRHTGSATQPEGNAPANSQWLNVVFSGFTLNQGDYVMLRWRDRNGGGDYGLALDIFPVAVPEPRAVGAAICAAVLAGGTWWQRRRQAAQG